MNINRQIPPQASIPDKLRDISVIQYQTSNGIPVYHLASPEREIVRIDIVFQAGTRHQESNFIAGCANSLLTEGTKQHSGQEIAELTDYFGSYIYPYYDRDEAGLTGFFLQKHARQNLELIAELILNPVFPTQEIEIFKLKKRQQLILDQQKPESIARKRLIESLFGALHPYGIHGSPTDLDQLNTLSLKEFHQKYYLPQNARIILTCHDADQNLQVINDMLQWPVCHPKTPIMVQPVPRPTVSFGYQYHQIEQATQVAIRMGIHVPGPKDPDYRKVNLVNTLLGGYFGSRLMQNVREEKGLTYSIGSAIVSHQEASFLTIMSSVSRHNYQQAILECKKEIQKLRDSRVSKEEMKVMINYLSGEFQRQLDGALSTADTLKGLLSSGLTLEYLQEYLLEVKHADPTMIQETAQKYLDPDQLVIQAVGPADQSQ